MKTRILKTLAITALSLTIFSCSKEKETTRYIRSGYESTDLPGHGGFLQPTR